MRELKLERIDAPGGVGMRVLGSLALSRGAALWRGIERGLRGQGTHVLDLSGVESMDGAGAAMLLSLKRRVEARGGSVEIVGARDEFRALLDVYAHGPEPPDARATAGLLARVGGSALAALRSARSLFSFAGDLVLGLLAAVRAPRSVPWSELGPLVRRAGADGVPIVALLNFLVGATLALQSAPLLGQYGANVFAADLVGLAVVRELGPLMTAILVCGRSGAAYAAELGTMQVGEEIDALRALGMDPQRYLVLPRVLALALATPVLTLFGIAVALLGGAAVATARLGVAPVAYWNEMRSVLSIGDLLGGIGKAAVFGALVGLVACQRGLSARKGASDVGSSTTSAVVIVLLGLVLLDALAAAFFDVMGI
jgi:phospholipid/cholesterol/gamma-HCH transport system permease protein